MDRVDRLSAAKIISRPAVCVWKSLIQGAIVRARIDA